MAVRQISQTHTHQGGHQNHVLSSIQRNDRREPADDLRYQPDGNQRRNDLVARVLREIRLQSNDEGIGTTRRRDGINEDVKLRHRRAHSGHERVQQTTHVGQRSFPRPLTLSGVRR